MDRYGFNDQRVVACALAVAACGGVGADLVRARDRLVVPRLQDVALRLGLGLFRRVQPRLRRVEKGYFRVRCVTALYSSMTQK